MRLGIHLSIGRGFRNTLKEAKDLGCNTVQVFSKNPRSWKSGKFDKDGAEFVRREKENFDIRPWVVHVTYLINPCSPDTDLYQKSLEALNEELARAEAMGAEYFVLHPGNRKNSSVEAGIVRLQNTLEKLLEDYSRITLLVEGMAGSGSQLGASFEELATIVAPFSTEKVGICLDTCHLFAAGYDIRDSKGWERTLNLLFSLTEKDRFKLLHVNDSVYSLGEKKDRHTHLGKGEIGREGFEAMLSMPELNEIPLILETPGPSQKEGRENLEFLRALQRSGAGD